MKIPLVVFESVGEYYAKILRRKANIKDIDDFMKYKDNLAYLHEITGIELTRLELWLRTIDLFRIPKLSVRDAEVLVQAEIRSVYDLAHREATRILYKIREIDEETYSIILRYPSLSEIEEWIQYAKLMIRRLKKSLNIPLILFPMVNFDIASELKRYRIFTVEDLDGFPLNILRKNIKMPNSDFEKFRGLLDLIHVEGIDLYFAEVFYESGFRSLPDLEKANSSEIYEKVKQTQAKEPAPVELLSIEMIENIKAKLKYTKEIFGGILNE